MTPTIHLRWRTVFVGKSLLNQSKKEINQSDTVQTQVRHLSSPKFLRNFSYLSLERASSWNSYPGPYYLYPSTPLEPVLPSDAYFGKSEQAFEPIGRGARKIGKMFRKSLGGNSPSEQFTVVITTYNREPHLMTLLSRLQGLPFLNKVGCFSFSDV